jgi:hypothetical protein
VRSTRRGIDRVDHGLVASGDADGLFAEDFRLPVAWPMADYGGFVSGGTRWGNVNVEVIRDARPRPEAWAGAGASASPSSPPNRWMRPSATSRPAASRAGRRGRGARGRPSPSPTSWSTTRRSLCRYLPGVYQRYPVLTEDLRERGGGSLGIDAVAGVVVGVPDVATAGEGWGRLLAPATAQRPGCWPLGDGPAVRLEASDAERIGWWSVSAMRSGRRGRCTTVVSRSTPTTGLREPSFTSARYGFTWSRRRVDGAKPTAGRR